MRKWEPTRRKNKRKNPDNKGSIAVGRSSPETEMVILTNGIEYEYQTPPPKSVAMREEMRM